MENKRAWMSKSVWAGLIIAIAPFIPVVGDKLLANPEIAMNIIGAIVIGLRLITKKPIVLKD